MFQIAACTRGAGGGLVRLERIDAPRLLIGRREPAKDTDVPVLDLMSDTEVSRDHALVSREDGKWYIEDLGSRNGTFVEDADIRGQGRVVVPPGVPVLTGKTRWALIPGDAVTAQFGPVVVFAPFVNVINYALYHCGAPVIGELCAVNLDDAVSSSWRLGLEIAEYGDVSEVVVPPLKPHAHLLLGTPVLLLHGDMLKSQIGPARTRLQVHINGREQASAAREIAVLSFWDWSHDCAARSTIATFVSPHARAVRRIVEEAGASPASMSGVSSFDQVLASGRKDAVRVVLEALYGCLAGGHDMKWTRPQISTCLAEAATYQTVRPPDRVFADALDRDPRATCLDLAVLFASCIEYLGLCPLIFFTGVREGVPGHAFAGAWAGATPGDRPVILNAKCLTDEVSAENLFVVECTGVASGPARPKLSFAEAVAEAVEELGAAQWVSAVDIGSLRPPQGNITPMEFPLSPEVARAYRDCDMLAKEKGRDAVETGFLVYGLLAADGEVTRMLCGVLGIDSREKSRSIRESVSTLSAAAEARPTWSLSECQRLARVYAWHSGVRTICEREVWAALLHEKIQSRSLQAACRVMGTTPEELRAVFRRLFPRFQEMDRPLFPSSRGWSGLR